MQGSGISTVTDAFGQPSKTINTAPTADLMTADYWYPVKPHRCDASGRLQNEIGRRNSRRETQQAARGKPPPGHALLAHAVVTVVGGMTAGVERRWPEAGHGSRVPLPKAAK